ncbi:hypothetical protein [Actinomadura sediminis]|uniref:HK97 gp10 family phage protein n=1 Tax=Actinomadura sediminis TaxID=1038904 RepID=A0ABW3ERQ4_9ACTN
MPGRNFVTVSGRRELARLARDIRALEDGRGINDELRSELADVARPLVLAVRASIRSIPSRGQSARMGRRSLRSKMAAATEYKVRTTRRPGVIVWVNPRRMPPGENNLPGYMDGQPPFHRWRHPVFDRPDKRTTWVQQRPHPYFDRATRGAGRAAERAAERVMDYIADRIEQG